MDTDGELVKYMSNLPKYLERGIHIQEKAFNIGVLDWGNLKKWQHKHKLEQQRPRGAAVSCSDISRSLLTDGLRSDSTDHCHSAVHEKIHGRQFCAVSSKDNHDVRSHDWSTQGGGYHKGTKKAQESNGVVVPFPRDLHYNLFEESLCSTNISSMKLKKADRKSFLAMASEVSSDITESYILPCELDHHKRLQLKQCGSFNSGPFTCSSAKPVVEAPPASLFPVASASKDTESCQSSPCRSFLDPISKPQRKSSFQHSEPPSQGSISLQKMYRPSKSTGIWSSRLKCCRTIDVSDSQLGKSGMSKVQALVRLAFNDGLPLYTFTVKDESDILVATVKNTSRKSSCKWSYTLFKVPAVKREKACKMKGGGKVEAQNCYPIVVSQLKVSEFHFSKSTRQKEFVLFTRKPTKDELAAVVVHIQSKACPDTVLHDCHCEPLEVGFRGSSVDIRSCSKDGKNLQDQSLFGNENHISTTVILPSGLHSLPSKGEPSSLIERWKSGGSCDCGGWDLGCKLRILVNEHHLRSELSSSEACTSGSIDKLAVFTQVDEHEDQPTLTLSPSKEGIYSVEFNSSISELQAFSICIAVLDCGSPSQFEQQRKNKETSHR